MTHPSRISKSLSLPGSVILLAVLALTAAAGSVALTSCKDRNRGGTAAGSTGALTEDEVARREAAQKAEALRLEIEAKTEAGRVEIARKKLEERIRLFRAVSGEFYGRFASVKGGSADLQTRILIQADHIPADYLIDRATHSSEIQALSAEMSLSVDTDDRGVGDAFRIISCSVSAVKPDFSAGLIRVVCATPLSGTTRVYTLGFELNNAPAEEAEAGSTTPAAQARAREAAEDLGRGFIDRIDSFSMTIIGTEKNLHGRLHRVPVSLR